MHIALATECLKCTGQGVEWCTACYVGSLPSMLRSFPICVRDILALCASATCTHKHRVRVLQVFVQSCSSAPYLSNGGDKFVVDVV